MKSLLFVLVFFPIIVFGFEPTITETPFTDYAIIPEYARTPIDTLVEKGILKGNDDGSFAPGREINRAEFCKLIVESSGVKKYTPISSSFPDVLPQDWFFTYVETARREGWIEGYPDGSFNPAENINRAEIAKVLTIAFGLDISKSSDDIHWYDPYVRALAERKLLPFNAEQSVFLPSKRPDRAEVSEHVFKMMKYVGLLEFDEFDVADIKIIYRDRDGNANQEDQSDKPLEERTIIDYTPKKTSEVEFEYIDEDALTQKIESQAGQLEIKKNVDSPRRVYVSPNQGSTEIHRLNMWADDGTVKLYALQFRFNGNKGLNLFKKTWIEINNQKVTTSIAIDDQVATYTFSNPIVFKDQWVSMKLMGDIELNVSDGDAARAVLFLPEWISANTNKKIGFFPFGGPDLIVK